MAIPYRLNFSDIAQYYLLHKELTPFEVMILTSSDYPI